MPYSKKTTHEVEGVARLVEQFKDKPNVRGMLASYLRQIQDIENVACGLLEDTELPTVEPDPFVWSGAFPFPAQNNSDLYKYLGVDGVVSADIGENSSHLWIGPQDGPSSTMEDKGTLTDVQFRLGSANQTTDPNFGLGAIECWGLVSKTERHQILQDVTSKMPTPQDGTKSFIGGGIVRIDDVTGSPVPRSVVSQLKNSSGQGWDIALFNSSLKLRFRIAQNSYATQDNCQALEVFVPGEMFAFLFNLDVAAGKMKIVTSAPNSYNEIAWSDVGSFDSVDKAMHIGDSNIPGVDGFIGLWCQSFMFQYSGSLDAGFGAANMDNFLKYCDGFLTV